MLKGKTKSGFEFKVTDARLNNYELLENVADVDENPLLLPKVVNLLLGKEQAGRLKDHVRDDDGMVDSEKLGVEIQEIFNFQEIKNS